MIETILNGRGHIIIIIRLYRRSLGPFLRPERRPWACQAWFARRRLFRKGLVAQPAEGSEAGEGEVGAAVGATDLREGQQGGGQAGLGCRVQEGPGTTCKTCMARPARASWCTHTLHPVLTASHSSN